MAHPRSRGFTLVELLVTLAILVGLVSMASAIYSTYVHDADIDTLQHNLFMLRSAIQQFYLDQGRYPIASGADVHGNPVSFLDPATSELVQGVHYTKGAYPGQQDPAAAPGVIIPGSRVRYLGEIPIDPTTNLANWDVNRGAVKATDINPSSSLGTTKVVTNVWSSNPEFRDM